MEDAKRGKYSKCKKELEFYGLNKNEIETICAKYMTDDEEIEDDETIEDDEEIEDSACVSKKISILAKEHPDWKHDKKVAVAHAYCGLSKTDAIDLSNILKRSSSLSLSKFSTLIKALKTRIGLKVPHMGILPQKTVLPMKNLNRLQTKLEKTVTAESKWLTAEQYEQRKQYAKYMRKTDADTEEKEMIDEEFTDSINTLYAEIINYYPDLNEEEALDRAFEPPRGDNAWILSDESEIVSMNDGLNNIIKAPIILAKEMVQSYTNDKGEIEYHFKPYEELKDAIERIKQEGSLDIIIEHQDWYDNEHIIGTVKEFRADDDNRDIRGMGYFNVQKLPKGLLKAIRDGEAIPVSIGFLAKLATGGNWNGIDYKYTQRNIHLRHLAICLDSVARCPVGVCGVNLEDAKNPENTKFFTIIKKPSYYLNICNIINDSKKETNKNLNQNSEKVEIMQKDSKTGKKLKGDEPVLIEAFLARLRSMLFDDEWEEELADPDSAIDRIVSALKMAKRSDSIMEEKEFSDAIAEKEAKIEELNKMISDAKEMIGKYEEKERLNLIQSIKKFGDKYSDEELQDKDIPTLEIIADAVSKFSPSEDKAEVLPVAGKDDKEKMEDNLEEKVERIDFSRVFEDINKEFNM